MNIFIVLAFIFIALAAINEMMFIFWNKKTHIGSIKNIAYACLYLLIAIVVEMGII